MRILFYFLTFISFVSLSQNCPYLGPDQFLQCGVNSTTLTADFSQCSPGSNPNETTTYSVLNIPYIAQTNTGTQLTMTDDSQQGPFNIGFPFCFFGQTYNQFYVGSNGWISFSAGQPTTFTSATIPSTAATIPKNCIMGPWQDWHPGIGGQIRYQIQGTAPCRKLVVSWINVPFFQCTTTIGTFHIVIYESTNVIENHIQSKPNCTSWAGGTAVQGIHNVGGTVGITVTGRNSTQWTANNESYRYTPNGAQVLPTPTWYQVGNPVPIGQGLTITVTPPPNGANYTCQLIYPSCNSGWNVCNSLPSNSPDTVFVMPGPQTLNPPLINVINPTCNTYCDGSIEVIPSNGQPPYVYTWNNNQNTSLIDSLCSGTYNFTLMDSQGCDYNGIITLTDPPPFTINPIIGTQPDTICYNSPNNLFQITNIVPSPIYIWSTSEGTLTNFQNDQINVNLTGVDGGFYDDMISVYGVNGDGCQSQTETFDVFVLNINPTIDSIPPICEYNDCVPLIATPSGGIFTGLGVFNDQLCPDSTIVGLNTIIYTYTQSNCVFDTFINVNINQRPDIYEVYNNIGSIGYQFNELCEGESITNTYNTATSGGINTWYVFGDTINSQNLILEWNQIGSYTFYVTTEDNGCVSYPYYYDVSLQQCPLELIFIPNTFTPDNDGYNQEWKPIFTEGFDPYDFNLTIYNRWGEIIWETYNSNASWDGTYGGNLCSDGIYTWVVSFGVPENDKRVVKHGFLTIIR